MNSIIVNLIIGIVSGLIAAGIVEIIRKFAKKKDRHSAK